MEHVTESLSRKIETLTPDQLSKVEKLISLLQSDDSAAAILALSEPAFAQVWGDAEDDVYDGL